MAGLHERQPNDQREEGKMATLTERKYEYDYQEAEREDIGRDAEGSITIRPFVRKKLLMRRLPPHETADADDVGDHQSSHSNGVDDVESNRGADIYKADQCREEE